MEQGITQLVLSTPDLIAAPSQSKLVTGVQFLLNHVERRQQVYVHCKAGRTRSATLVACYLMQVLLLLLSLLLLHPFNSVFSRTTWVSRHLKGKPFSILLDQEMIE